MCGQFAYSVPSNCLTVSTIPIVSLILSQDKPYEYVTVQAVELVSVSADGSPFAQYIGPGEGATTGLL